FFPLLRKETFLQEGRHLEIDDKGNFSMQGVVYNEMKGNYSSFGSVAFDEQFKSVHPSSCYVYDSGGDPLSIAEFSYDDFKNFHNTYYRPENCLLFLYGNIPLKELLDFIQENFLERLEKKFPLAKEHRSYPFVSEHILKMEMPSSMNGLTEISATAPKSGAKNSNVTLNFRYGTTSCLDETMELAFIMQLLSGNDSSPMSKVLTDSKLGERLIAGFSSDGLPQTAYFGLRGVKKSQKQKVKSLIFSTLESLCKNGVPENDIEAALLSVDFSNREVVRVNGDPFSMILMDRALNGWCYGAHPASTLLYISAFEKVKKNLSEDKNYISNLIRKIFLENKNCSFVEVSPSNDFLKQREKSEKKIVDSLSQKINQDELKKELDLLREYQTKKESEKETECIPRIQLSDLSPVAERYKIETTFCKGCDGEVIPLFVSTEDTNGILHFDVCFPIDTLPTEEWPYLALFTTCAFNAGWKNKPWDKCVSEIACVCGDMSMRVSTGISVCEKNKALPNYVGRDWIIASIKFTEEKAKKALTLFAEAMSTMNFSDSERVKTILDESLNGMASSVIPSGTRYASVRSQAQFSRTKAIEELLSGFTQLFILQKFSDGDVAKMSEHFSFILNHAFASGAVLHITGDEKSLESVRPLVDGFASELKLHSIKTIQTVSDDDLFNLIKMEEFFHNEKNEIFTSPSQVGYSALSFCTKPVSHIERAARKVLCHYLHSSLLWEKVRVIGGAYGANATSDFSTNIISFSSYRDPSPFKSLETFFECVKEVAEQLFSDSEVEKAVTGTYGTITRPQSPASKAYQSFRNILYGLTDAERDKRLESVLRVKKDDIKSAAFSLLEEFSKAYKVVLCDKSAKAKGFSRDLLI
ncbi:MAG: insulinase family protein, partial [Treponema sp.]|nr:insulinase family protein [Treponema sp.]